MIAMLWCLKLKLIYDRQSASQPVLVPGSHLGPMTRFLLSLWRLRVSWYGAPSLTRGWVCNLLLASGPCLATLYLYGFSCHGNVSRHTCDVYLQNVLTVNGSDGSRHVGGAANVTRHKGNNSITRRDRLQRGERVWTDPSAIILGSELIICNTYRRHQKSLRKARKLGSKFSHLHGPSLKLKSVAWVRERTIPTERQPLAGEISGKFCG
jgi:hypothetical protein